MEWSDLQDESLYIILGSMEEVNIICALFYVFSESWDVGNIAQRVHFYFE